MSTLEQLRRLIDRSGAQTLAGAMTPPAFGPATGAAASALANYAGAEIPLTDGVIKAATPQIAVIPDSIRRQIDAMASGQDGNLDAPPSLEKLSGLLSPSAPGRPPMRKPKYTRSNGPTIDPLTGQQTPDAPPTRGDSYRDQIRNLLANTDTVGGANGVTSDISFSRPGDPRKGNATIEFKGQTGGSIFDNERGRQYATAVQARQEALDRGESPDSLPPLPGLRGVGIGTPAGQPVAGGKTDQYNKMKAAQRAEQLANQAKAPSLIMAREQMRSLGPRGAVMARMLAGGQGSMNDPVMLAAAGMSDAADAALRNRTIDSNLALAQSRDRNNVGAAYLEGGGDPSGYGEFMRSLGGGQATVAPAANPFIPAGVSRNRLPPQEQSKAIAFDSLARGERNDHTDALFDDISKKVDKGFGPDGLQPWSADSMKSVLDAIESDPRLSKIPNIRKMAEEWLNSKTGPVANSTFGAPGTTLNGIGQAMSRLLTRPFAGALPY